MNLSKMLRMTTAMSLIIVMLYFLCEIQTNRAGRLSVNAASCLPARPQKAIAAAPVGAVPSHLATLLC